MDRIGCNVIIVECNYDVYEAKYMIILQINYFTVLGEDKFKIKIL